ncbi:glycoside hydrolase family 99-like domain-containing protein [Halomonas ventosae]|uniref:Lipopolysaccharide biosynthesis protein n=1 Tax=Halomonas ventosae TaxID=229007 RepID=A0A4R6HQE4_9GAMM|nr:glycoside hydrolase family 99-like domain-containing protein [Halomonas ventosae]TDO10656.1 lipopolysaccharide biosynthesis protein [Halomonas ventosae]
MNEPTRTELPKTGERFLPQFEGDIVAEHYHRYLFARRYVADRRVLDIACGEGYGSHLLAGVAQHVIGVDIAADAVAHATQHYARDNLEYRQGDCAAIPLPDASVDVVVSFETIEHHDRHAAMLSEIKRVLRPHGLLIISSPDKREYSDVPGYANPYHVKELYRDEFEALLARHFARHAVVGQRVVYASAIIDSAAPELTTYDANDPEGRSGLPHPLYLLALASDGELPAGSSSLYLHGVEKSDAALEREATIQAREMELEQRGAAVAERDASIAMLEQQLKARVHAHAILASHAHAPTWLFKQLLRRLKRRLAEWRAGPSARYRIAASGLFDPAWYLSHNPDVQSRRLDPLDHFLHRGGFEGRDPSPHFNTLDWLCQHPWLIEQHQHPLLHYLDHQPAKAAEGASDQSRAPAAEGALFEQLFQDATQVAPTYVPLDDASLPEPPQIRAIAFYLPQFHPIPENDRWWGKGFTEWTNVSKAVPQFIGHYQPRQPGELGFYDLRLPQVQERQVELARQHGLAAFCFHYYWFSGRKRLLEAPIDQYVANPNIDFPFCLCWANENWTRRWDGQENDVLIEQKHQPQDDLEFIEDVAPLLADPRYLRVDGKPLLIVYRVDILPDARKTAETWRRYCREQGIGELHLVAAQSFGIGDPRPYGFDAAVEFPPHDTHARRIEERLEFINPDHQGQVYDYCSLVETQLAKPPVDYLRYRTVFPSWDNEARKPGRGFIFAAATPGRYQQWLAGACREANALPEAQRLVFINAWNEWAEGAYLEPDRRYGYAYLAATRNVMQRYCASALPALPAPGFPVPPELHNLKARHATAVVLHLYYTELWDEVTGYLANLEDAFDLYVTLPPDVETPIRDTILAWKPDAHLIPLPNHGRDILPFLRVMNAIAPLGYQQVCKVHAKRSVHRGDGDRWRQAFFGQLLGSRRQVAAILDAFARHPELGMVGPHGHWLEYRLYWGDHRGGPEGIRRLLDTLGVSLALEEVRFFAGSMFWCRPQAVAPLLEQLALDDFEEEAGQTDGTLAHALERVFAAVCQGAGMRVTDTQAPAAAEEPLPVHPYPFAHSRVPLGHAPAEEGALDAPRHRFKGWLMQRAQQARRRAGALKRRLS